MIEGAGPVAAVWGLSVRTLAAAGGVIVSRNLFHAVLFLILVFLGIAGFFLLLSADFLAMAQIIIYVGAIAVLILFAIVLTPRASRDNGETRMAPAALVVAIGVAGLLIPA
ncbi:MAG: NADH-quinone oxidoreductase subunit J, partial [Dehalococcoidia bacterium]|nr:NADH-quinone oxidoreductase subunit J [Dehalococcoidia bacterium]